MVESFIRISLEAKEITEKNNTNYDDSAMGREGDQWLRNLGYRINRTRSLRKHGSELQVLSNMTAEYLPSSQEKLV